ncbi:MAG: tyrosine-type recombinase/integrase [Pirellulaceae bacterium]
MASLQKESTGVFHIVFRFHGRRFKRSLETKVHSIAVTRQQEIEETIVLLKRDRIGVPDGIPAEEFILAGGQVSQIRRRAGTDVATNASSNEQLTLKKIFSEFFEALPEDSLELTTLRTMRTHKSHLLNHFKPSFKIQQLTGQALQEYVNARAKHRSQYVDVQDGVKPERRRVSGNTIKMELVTLGIVWRWATSASLLTGAFPNRGLRYPKADEKPPFRTYAEIAYEIESQQLTGSKASALWNCLYLNTNEIAELLRLVQDRQEDLAACCFPMVATAAFTGARRSELLRAQKSDVDLRANVLTVREKKRVRGRRSTRRVPISSTLRPILENWLAKHSGGTILFCEKSGVSLTPGQAQRLIGNALKNSKWDILKGWHTLRHSFISNLACKAIDQRLIDEFVGHTTEEMRRRYRHLFPEVKQDAIDSVFG